jgi:hypothetical protein
VIANKDSLASSRKRDRIKFLTKKLRAGLKQIKDQNAKGKNRE